MNVEICVCDFCPYRFPHTLFSVKNTPIIQLIISVNTELKVEKHTHMRKHKSCNLHQD